MEVTNSWRQLRPGAVRPPARMSGWLRWFSTASLVIGWAGVAVLATPRVFTVTDLDSAMKAVGRYVDQATRAIASTDFETAKTRVARAREQLSTTFSFWILEKRPDAMKMVRNATTTLDDLDAVLSATPVDPSAVTAAVGRVDLACQACHAIYREEDAATRTFRLKPRPWEP